MMRHRAALNYKVTLEKYEQKGTSLFEKLKHYATFGVKRRTYDANVKENFLAQVNVVL